MKENNTSKEELNIYENINIWLFWSYWIHGYYLFVYSLIQSHYIAQVGLAFLTLLSGPSECWDWLCATTPNSCFILLGFFLFFCFYFLSCNILNIYKSTDQPVSAIRSLLNVFHLYCNYFFQHLEIKLNIFKFISVFNLIHKKASKKLDHVSQALIKYVNISMLYYDTLLG